MLESLLQDIFIDVLNAEKLRFGAPPIPKNAPLRKEDINDSSFDIIDAKMDPETIKRPLGQGIASYINGTAENTHPLRFVCYDEYIKQFTYNDGLGHPTLNQLKDNFKTADYVVYDMSDKKEYFIVHELSTGRHDSKFREGKQQLSNTVHVLCECPVIKLFIASFSKRLCILSITKENITSPLNMAAPFIDDVWSVLPEVISFNFGQIAKNGFEAYETLKVQLPNL